MNEVKSFGGPDLSNELPSENGAKPDLVARRLGRMAIGLAGIGLASELVIDTLSFLRQCMVENIGWMALGVPPSTVAECAKESLAWIPIMLRHLW